MIMCLFYKFYIDDWRLLDKDQPYHIYMSVTYKSNF